MTLTFDLLTLKLLRYCTWGAQPSYFLFKNFIALWRHLAKTQLLFDAQIYLYNVNDSSCVFARWRPSAIKFSNKKLMTVFAEVHQFPRNSVMEFQNICNEMVDPFFAPPCTLCS